MYRLNPKEEEFLWRYFLLITLRRLKLGFIYVIRIFYIGKYVVQTFVRSLVAWSLLCVARQLLYLLEYQFRIFSVLSVLRFGFLS